MKSLFTITALIIAVSAAAQSPPYIGIAQPGFSTTNNSAIAPPSPAAEPTAPGRFYADSLFSISTPDFSHGEELGYGVGVGYAFTKTLSADLRVTHAGLNFENNAVSTVGGRAVSRLPFTFLSPYGYVGAQFDLGPDQWKLCPGIGLELGITKLMRGMSVFAEGGPNVDLTGHSTWLFGAGLRWRF